MLSSSSKNPLTARNILSYASTSQMNSKLSLFMVMLSSIGRKSSNAFTQPKRAKLGTRNILNPACTAFPNTR